ncbi:TetR/AcrR family transcriptional regulator [Butyrivibrio sp. NC3005]|uniref:TetR/AcrR family transcriptional regulator n=1 Tax=Butyrivibrio sp. NC3005 TaxID=1280685 RepID=UPI00047A9C81|nr:TetR/AcrR family transcriptional regulator [Butyrivibrio sp. NC3005]
MGKLDNNKKQKRDSLLNTSFEFFITKGIEKTSISDIVQKAGVAKGTFYLYFKDKYDIRNRLIAHKSSQLFSAAYLALSKKDIKNLEDKIIFIIDYILDELNHNKPLLMFIHKDLSWGVFKKALTSSPNNDDIDFQAIYKKMLEESDNAFIDPEIMLFMIIELVSATGYSAILGQDPCSLAELKPHLFRSIRDIIKSHTIESGKKE